MTIGQFTSRFVLVPRIHASASAGGCIYGGIAARLSRRTLDGGILRLRVAFLVGRARVFAFIADFSERSSVRRVHGDRNPWRAMGVPVSHEENSPLRRRPAPRVCGSCESRARFVDARLTIAWIASAAGFHIRADASRCNGRYSWYRASSNLNFFSLMIPIR